MIWYPFIFWLITLSASIVAFPKVLFRGQGQRARWISPDRGMRDPTLNDVSIIDEK